MAATVISMTAAVPSSLDVGPEQPLPTLAMLYPTGSRTTVSALCHVLLYYGVSESGIAKVGSGRNILDILTNDERATQTFGATPFVETRYGLRYLLANDPLSQNGFGESHRDQCMATFAAVGCPLKTPIVVNDHQYTIRNLLDESIANFDFDQQELAWTTIAYSRYIPPASSWTNRFGSKITFSELADRLLATDLDSQSCAGTHIIEALASIASADQKTPILSEEVRFRVRERLHGVVMDAIRLQTPEGSWSWKWCSLVHGDAPPTLQNRVLVTGHVLETLLLLRQVGEHLPDTVANKGAIWLKNIVRGDGLVKDASWICPITHALRSASTVLSETKTLSTSN